MINLIQTIISILCLIVGFYFGFRVGKTKELPEINPIEVADKVDTQVTAIKKKKEQKKDLDKFNQAMKNMERFDGTGEGQEPIKK